MPSSSSSTATIVVVAKTPVAGQSKTRLIPALGAAGSAVLAQAMLLDVLTTVTAACSVSECRRCECMNDSAASRSRRNNAPYAGYEQ